MVDTTKFIPNENCLLLMIPLSKAEEKPGKDK